MCESSSECRIHLTVSGKVLSGNNSDHCVFLHVEITVGSCLAYYECGKHIPGDCISVLANM